MTDPGCVCGSDDGELVLRGRFSRLGVTDYPFDIVRCQGCRLARTVPRPDPDQYLSGYSLTTEGDTFTGAAQDGWSGGIVNFIQAHGGAGRLLDIGCHVGNLVQEAVLAGFEAEGIDSDPIAVQHGASLGRPIHNRPLTSLDHPYDVVVLNHVLEHVEALPDFLRDIERVLAPGGKLFVFVPHWRGLMPRLMGQRWMGWVPHQHVWHFDPARLTALVLQETQLRLVTCTTRGVIEPPSAGVKGLGKAAVNRASRLVGWGDQVEAVFARPAA